VRCKDLEVNYSLSILPYVVRAQGILLMYFVMVLYEGKRVVGIIIATLKILGMMPCEVWCISPVYACYCMIFNNIVAAFSAAHITHSSRQRIKLIYDIWQYGQATVTSRCLQCPVPPRIILNLYTCIKKTEHFLNRFL
jgi:hypothetical protein